jgi:filamentous hemagglutinin family protein
LLPRSISPEVQLNHRYILSAPNHGSTGKPSSSETTPGSVFRGAPSGGRYRFAGTLTLLGLLAAPGVHGAPAGGNVVGGSGSIAQSGATTTITQDSARLAINWNSFSSKAGESIVFRQPGASAIALNRVTGTGASELSGSLNANGQVFILNPNGVLFGAGATVNAQGLLASTLDMDPARFMQGGPEHVLEGTSAGSLGNQGKLTANPGGYIALIAPRVVNQGSVSAQQGYVLMAAGDKARVQLSDSGLLDYTIDRGSLDALVDNRVAGMISANGGTVMLEAKAADALSKALVNHDGMIEAQTLNRVSGRVKLMGDMQRGQLTMNGQIDVSAPVSGAGGAIETSAANVKILNGARVYAQSKDGVNGSWLIDPENFSIVEGSAPSTSSSIGNDTLMNALNNGAVTTLRTQESPGPGGDISVNATVTWGGTSKLALIAHRNIYINADLTVNGNAGLSLQTGQSEEGIGTYFFNNARINLADTAAFTTKQGLNGPVTPYTVITALGRAIDSGDAKTLQGLSGAGNYVLGRDIDATATRNWNPDSFGVANGFRPIQNFSGTLDGLGNRITGLFINRPTEVNAGLFSSIVAGAKIRNINLVDANVTAVGNAGILAGLNYGTISNVSSTGNVTGAVGGGTQDGFYIGGLVGQNLTTGNIDRSSSAANVTGTQGVGGLVGVLTEGASISNSNASGKVTAIKQGNNALQWFGGLVGVNIRSTIRNSYAEGDVSAGEMIEAGGLVGENGGLIRNSYAVGNVTGRKTIGGLTGIVSLESGAIENSYATGSVNAVGNNAAEIGGLAGFMQLNTKVTNSYATGPVNVPGNNSANIGGLIGFAQGNAKVTNSYATGPVNVTGSNPVNINGLIGAADKEATAVSSYWNTDSIANGGTGIGPSSNPVLGVGKTGKELRATETFANNGWSISNVGGSDAVWRIYEGVSMPLLRNFMQNVELGGLSSRYNGGEQNGTQPLAPRLAFTTAKGTDVGTYFPSSTQQGYDIQGGNLVIFPALLTVSTENVIKTYDGTNTASGVPIASNDTTLLGGDRFSGGTFEFNNKNASAIVEGKVQPDKTVTVSNVIINNKNGENGGKNYIVSYEANRSSTINQAELTVTTESVSKTYDGTNIASGVPIAVNNTRLYGDDKFSGGTFLFNDRNASAIVGGKALPDKIVNVSGVTVDDGNGGKNYQVRYQTKDGNTIIPASVTFTMNEAVTKTYDGTTAVPNKPVATTASGKIFKDQGDSFSGGTFVFNDRNASATKDGEAQPDKTVIISDVTVSDGNGGKNYVVTYQPKNGNTIKPAPLKVTVTDITKTYDGTTSADGASVASEGLLAPDKLLAGPITFADRNADTNRSKQLNIGSLVISDGNNGRNYDLTYVPSTKSRITPAPLTVSVGNVVKTYDGTLNATAKPVLVGGTLFGGELFNGTLFPKDSLPDNGLFAFTDRNAGTGNKTVSVSGVTVNDGNGGQNYQVSYVPNRSSTINPAVLAVSTANVAKTYDGTVNAPGAGAAIVEGQLGNGDTLNGGTFAFADRNAGIGNKAVTVSGITVNDGNGGNNYLLRLSPNLSSTISPAPLTVTANGDRKAYDATPYEGGNGVVISGLKGGDNADVVSGQLAYSGNAQGALLPGSYTITPGGLESRNYAISYANGALQIEQPPDLTSSVNLLNPMQRPGAEQTPPIGGATVQVAGCGISLPANALGVDCIAASAQRRR